MNKQNQQARSPYILSLKAIALPNSAIARSLSSKTIACANAPYKICDRTTRWAIALRDQLYQSTFVGSSGERANSSNVAFLTSSATESPRINLMKLSESTLPDTHCLILFYTACAKSGALTFILQLVDTILVSAIREQTEIIDYFSNLNIEAREGAFDLLTSDPAFNFSISERSF